MTNRSSFRSSIASGSGGCVVIGTGEFAAMKASACAPRWKWRRISQLASGDTKRLSPHARMRCSSRECDQRRGRKVLMT
ncbi:hypothetical protein D3C78_1814900 [compost metagenome]